MDKFDYLHAGNLSLNDKIYNYIVIKISEGEWKIGDKIPSESKLCKLFNVSRVSVRAAIQKLQGQGLIITRQGIGSFVTAPPSSKNLNIKAKLSADILGETFKEFFEFRQAIEFKAIELFVVRATQDDMDNLKKILERMKKCDGDRKLFSGCDFEFHMSILKGARNSFLYNAFVPYKEAFYNYILEINLIKTTDIKTLAKKHEQMYQFLLEKKPLEMKEYVLNDNSQYYKTTFKKDLS